MNLPQNISDSTTRFEFQNKCEVVRGCVDCFQEIKW